MPKAAAKAATPKKRARKTSAKAKPSAPQTAQAIDTPKDWPTDLTDDVATKLFDAIEGGDTIRKAAEGLGLKGNTVYQWRRRFPRFAERLLEAEEVGFDMLVDSYRDIHASDRDSAAGAQVAITVIDKFLARKRPERFHTNPFKPSVGGDGGMLLGVVVVPAKQALLPHDREVIDGEFTVSVPAKVSA